MEDEVRSLAKQTGLNVSDSQCSIGGRSLRAVSCHVNRYDLDEVESRFLNLGWVFVPSPPNANPGEHGDFKKNHRYVVLEAGSSSGSRSAITVGGFSRRGDA